MEKFNEKQLLVARNETKSYLSVGAKSFSKLKLSTSLNFFEQKMNTTFESLGCVGYNPTFKELTATVQIKRATGYSGDLCEDGSIEYVRFYMDYQDGSGWEDMGFVGLNVHDIPTEKDCDNKNEKPIDYVVRLQIEPKQKLCTSPNLPIVRAVLSWNVIPEANDPELTKGTYIWSDTKDAQIQISPFKFFISGFPTVNVDELLHTAVLNPDISLNKLASMNVSNALALKKAKQSLLPQELNFGDLAKTYQNENVEPHRFGYKMLKSTLGNPDLTTINHVSDMFELNNFSFPEYMVQLNQTECNTNYEELICVGADYNNEALVGTLKIKRPSGYSGDLCSKGSKEYVSFWIQTEDNCQWIHAGTTFVDVHDIQNIPPDGLFYSVVLPYKFQGLKKKCNKPQVLKIRAILSWNSKPEGLGCSHWGNVVESYVQIKPKSSSTGPKLVSIGGVSTSYIDSIGLTKSDYKFGFNQKDVTEKSAFGGIIVIQGLTDKFHGQQYRIKIENKTKNTVSYFKEEFTIEGYNPDTGPIFTNVSPVGDVYTYRGNNLNTYDVIARFSSSGNDMIEITLEHLDGSTPDSQVIQLDNLNPILSLNIDNYGDCSHFVKGQPISGDFSVEENHLQNYTLTTNVTDANNYVIASGDGTANSSGSFTIVTSSTKNCGSITLKAKPRTVINSVRMHPGRHLSKTICLADE